MCRDLGIAEDEVDGARDGTVTVELSVSVSVQGVLVTIEVAVVEHREIRLHAKGHSLVVLWASGVLNPKITCKKPISYGLCYKFKEMI